MRAALTFLLAIMLSLNATHANAVGICDVMKCTSGLTAHFGHHSHEHGDDHRHDERQAGAAEEGNAATASDHHHTHVHPSFLYLLPGMIGVVPLTVGNTLAAAAPATFISAAPSRLERPPRASLA